MPSLNFTKFVAAVESGEKPLTIRDIRKNPIRPGDTLYMFTGMRTRQCRPLKMPGGPMWVYTKKVVLPSPTSSKTPPYVGPLFVSKSQQDIAGR